jgi:membrane-associated phospholipid phosphatase
MRFKKIPPILRYASCVLVPWGGYYFLASSGIDRLVACSHEAALCRWERSLPGGASLPEHLAGLMKFASFNALMTGVYISFYAVLLGTPAWLMWQQRDEAFGSLRRQWALAGFLGYLTYFLVPARSPYYVLGIYDHPEFSFSQALVRKALEGGIAFPHDAFPSMHVAFATLAVLVAGRVVGRHAQIALLVWLALLLLSVMATGAHWGVDVAAGLFLAGAVHSLYSFRKGALQCVSS